MKKILLSIVFFLLICGNSWGATDTHHVTSNGAGTYDGSSLANAWSLADLYQSTNWDTDEDDDGKIGVGDTVYFYDDDGPFFGFLLIRQSGTAGKPIVFKAAPGETPEFWGAIDGSVLPVGTPSEMITNQGFETGDLTGWTKEDGGTSSVATSTEEIHSGTYSVKAVRSGTTIRFRRTITVEPNTWYNFTYWAIKTAGTSMGLIIDDNGTARGTALYLQDMVTGWSPTANSMDGHITNTGSWTRYSLVFRTGPNQTQIEPVWVGQSDGTTYLDDFSLKKIQWEQVSGNEYKMTPLYIGTQPSISMLGYPKNATGSTSVWWNDEPLTPGTLGSLADNECAWDTTNWESHINIGKSPAGENIKVPIFSTALYSPSGQDYITLDGLTVKYIVEKGPVVVGAAVFATGSKSDNWKVANMNIECVQSIGVANSTSSAGDNWEVSNNRFSHIWNGREYSDGGNGDTVSMDGENAVIKDNYGYDQYVGIITYGCNQRVINNILDGIHVNGIWAGGACTASPVLIANNTLYHNPPAGIAGHGIVLQDNTEPPGDAVSGAKIINNIVHTDQAGEEAHALCLYNSPNVELHNNLYYRTGGTTIVKLGYTGELAADIYTMAEYQAAMDALKNNATLKWTDNYGVIGGAADANSISVNPLFVSSTDFNLQSTSPCIDAGAEVQLSSDYAGTVVPQGRKPDIGAYEYPLGLWTRF